jgi:exonuclease SbcC
MRLIKLILHPFAGTVNKTYDFHGGLNVIHGRNEAGKSTIVKALQLALLTSTNLTKTEFKSQISSFIPIGGDTINIDLNFEVGGIEYELKKSWGVNNISSLNIVGQAGINNADIIQEDLFKLLNLNKSTVRDIIFTNQAKIASTIEGITKDKEIINSLDQILRGAILNNGGVNPENLKQQLTSEFEKLTDNWFLDNDSPIIKKDNKGAYENPWVNGVGEILKIAYTLYDKHKALEARLKYDENYTTNANAVNDLKGIVNNDKLFIELNTPLVESITKRKEINLEIEAISNKKAFLKDVQISWNSINASLPLLINGLELDREQLVKLQEEIDNARLSTDSVSKIARFENISKLKKEVESARILYKDVQVISNKDIAEVKVLYDSLLAAQTTLNGLEAAQKFVVNILPKSSFDVDIQHSAGLLKTTNLSQGQTISLQVNKGFLYSSAEVTIEVKSLTDQIHELNTTIADLASNYQTALTKYSTTTYQELTLLHEQYNTLATKYITAKSTYENALVGSNFEVLEQEVNKLKYLPKTRELKELEGLVNGLIGKIATGEKDIDKFNEQKTKYENTYESLEKVDEIRLGVIQEEKSANSKLTNLPSIDPNIDIDAFRNEYEEVVLRLKENEEALKKLELERATLEGRQPEDLASELQDEIDLLKRQKNQKVEEAIAIKKVLDKLNEILGRTPVNPYQNYENNLTQYLNTLSGGKYEVSTNGDVTPSVIKNSNTNLLLPIELLSEGTSGILGLSLRLTMADYYLANQNGFLAFDDPMVHFDEGRQAHASQCFQQYAENKQVLIFTCHQSHANQLGGNLISLN